MEEAAVAVLGAGVAGLAAFQRLRAAGCDAVLIEARARVGGRVHTLLRSDWPLPVELGAEFIHGSPPELAGLAGPDPEPGRRAWRFRNGVLETAGEFAGGADGVFSRMEKIQPPAPDRSFAAFLEECRDLPAEARAGALGFIEGFEAADPGRISVYSLNREFQAEDEDDDSGPRRPRGGYDQLLRQLRADGRIHLETTVRAVRWKPGEVTVAARNRDDEFRVRARCAIVTLPLSLLQQAIEGKPAAIIFEPTLEAKRAALGGLVMGGALRITLRLRQPLWREARDHQGNHLGQLGFLFGEAAESGHFPTWWTAPGSVSGAAQIVGWAAGRHAWALAGVDGERLRARAVADLAERLRLTSKIIEDQLLGFDSHDWQSDPFSLGAYSYAAVGGAGAHAALAEPLDGALFFAGEATAAAGDHATVHGALRSGQRAAAEALAIIDGRGPQRGCAARPA